MPPELKLFIWDEVLTDYADGIMFALAPDVETARDMLRTALGHDHDDMAKEPKIYTMPVARVVYGGM